MADDMLDFARMLGRRPDGDLVVLAGDRHGDMAFEIEMLLAADAHLAFEAARGIGQFGFRLAALQRHRRGDERAPFASASSISLQCGRSR